MKIIFLYSQPNMLSVFKIPSRRDDLFENQKHDFKLMGKKNNYNFTTLLKICLSEPMKFMPTYPKVQIKLYHPLSAQN